MNTSKPDIRSLGSLAVSALGWTAAGTSLGIGYTTGFGISHVIGVIGGALAGVEYMRKTLNR